MINKRLKNDKKNGNERQYEQQRTAIRMT